jgi:hypothetical protein
MVGFSPEVCRLHEVNIVVGIAVARVTQIIKARGDVVCLHFDRPFVSCTRPMCSLVLLAWLVSLGCPQVHANHNTKNTHKHGRHMSSIGGNVSVL